MANGFKEPKQNHLRKRTLKPLNKAEPGEDRFSVDDEFESQMSMKSHTMSNFNPSSSVVAETQKAV